MTFEERLAALEATAAANQLPATLAALQRKLEAMWQPDSFVLLGGLVAAPDADGRGLRFGENLGIRWGATTLTWAAAVLDSNAQTVTHGLGRLPAIVGAWGSDAATAKLFAGYPFSFTTTQFSLKGAANAAPGVQTVSATWIAIG